MRQDRPMLTWKSPGDGDHVMIVQSGMAKAIFPHKGDSTEAKTAMKILKVAKLKVVEGKLNEANMNSEILDVVEDLQTLIKKLKSDGDYKKRPEVKKLFSYAGLIVKELHKLVEGKLNEAKGYKIGDTIKLKTGATAKIIGVVKGPRPQLNTYHIISKGKKFDIGLSKIKEGKLTEAKKFKIGDMYSDDFDYVGMLKMGLKASVSWGPKKLEKLHSSFEDVNYHTEGGPIYYAAQDLKAGKKMDALKKLKDAQGKIKKALSGIKEGKLNEAKIKLKDLPKKLYALDKKKDGELYDEPKITDNGRYGHYLGLTTHAGPSHKKYFSDLIKINICVVQSCSLFC